MIATPSFSCAGAPKSGAMIKMVIQMQDIYENRSTHTFVKVSILTPRSLFPNFMQSPHIRISVVVRRNPTLLNADPNVLSDGLYLHAFYFCARRKNPDFCGFG